MDRLWSHFGTFELLYPPELANFVTLIRLRLYVMHFPKPRNPLVTDTLRCLMS